MQPELSKPIKKPFDSARERWEVAVVARSGRPPLRFKGRVILTMRRGIADGKDLFVEVWERKKGDFVVSYSDISTTQRKPEAFVFKGIGMIGAHLEAICATDKLRTSSLKVEVLLSEALQIMRQRKEFAILTGDFLAQLDELSPIGT